MKRISDLHFVIAEDQGFQRWLIANLLEQLGCRTMYPVSDGRAAVEVLAKLGSSIDVIISDLDMPGMDGMELIRRMSEHNHTAALIVVSAAPPAILRTIGTMAIAYGINFIAALQKPLTVKKLQDVLALLAPVEGRSHEVEMEISQLDVADAIRNGELEAFFQPKAQMPGGRVCGAEALVRWRHPQVGFIAPSGFMGLVEASGLARDVAQVVARSAMVHCQAWRAADLDLTVSVNLSPALLADTSLADRMTSIAAEAGIENRHVTFEVTEGAAIQDRARILETLTRLRLRGFGLSIDDYGTGYSSMERLSQIPFTELKIDQMFVRDAAADPTRVTFIESTLEMASKLGLSAVAEGVETQREWEMLLGLGCKLGQGYFIARPMEASRFFDWVTARTRACA
jgi:EAL domain-containing protein (putative c-di-GMP-specific phosphodiesterase class I)/FixJ family two-component response regulator